MGSRSLEQSKLGLLILLLVASIRGVSPLSSMSPEISHTKTMIEMEKRLDV